MSSSRCTCEPLPLRAVMNLQVLAFDHDVLCHDVPCDCQFLIFASPPGDFGGLGVQPCRKKINTGFYYGAQSNCVLGIFRKALKSRRFVKARILTNYQFLTRLFEKDRFRKFVSETTDLCIDRGLNPISGLGTTQNRRMTPASPHVSNQCRK